jgi:membrane-bound inhibitor of C-type lysozyme
MPSARPWSTITLALLLCACETGVRVTYYCGAAQRFIATIHGDTARVVLGGTTYRLGRVVADSGDRFSNGSVTLSTRGTDATLQVTDSSSFRNCTSAPHP